jgi:hypothetical protein
MQAGATRSALQGPDASKGGNSHGAVLPRELLVRVLCALTQAFRIPFDKKPVTGQIPPPYSSIVLAADLLGLQPGRSGRLARYANWSPRSWSCSIPVYASRTTVSSPVRVLPPLTFAAPNQRLAFYCPWKATASPSWTGEPHRPALQRVRSDLPGRGAALPPQKKSSSPIRMH